MPFDCSSSCSFLFYYFYLLFQISLFQNFKRPKFYRNVLGDRSEFLVSIYIVMVYPPAEGKDTMLMHALSLFSFVLYSIKVPLTCGFIRILRLSYMEAYGTHSDLAVECVMVEPFHHLYIPGNQ